eukprot:6494186-Alexandrium_andersonii.AAC.1
MGCRRLRSSGAWDEACFAPLARSGRSLLPQKCGHRAGFELAVIGWLTIWVVDVMTFEPPTGPRSGFVTRSAPSDLSVRA